ncbi:MAG: pseudouridine synthase [Bacteroidales bacterium]|nr:pseudouridine synthase [Bacteroidales bacterium]
MDNYSNRGNSGYSDNDSRGNNRGARPYQKRNNYQQNGNGGNRNFGNRRPYGNQNSDGNSRGYQGSRNYGNSDNREGNYGNRENNYNSYGNRDNGYGNRNGYGNPNGGYRGHSQNGGYVNRNNYGNQNRGQQGGYQRNGGYQNRNSQGGYGNDNQQPRPFYSKSGPKYTIDEQGYRHKRYWDHSDRKQKAIETAIESEDDFIENDGKIRLNKYLANSGMCSRREADRMIKAGMVQVNGEVVTEMGVKVNISDEVKYNGLTIKPEPKRYILLNKPKDYITTLKDPNARNTVMELIEGACKERVYPVGRLDRNTTGVLLFTNDGDLAKKLTHPSNEVQKIYHVSTDKPVSHSDLEKIAEGFELEDGFIAADEVAYADDHSRTEIGIRIHSGRNRIVRRIFEHLGYDVKKLDRVMFAGLTKKSLGRGHWRFLSDREVGFLNMISTKKGSETALDDVVDYEE